MEGADDLEKFANLAQLTHKEQAEFCLNALWEKGAEQRAEEFWTWKHKFDEFDIAKKAEGNALDELNAHRFLESLDDPHTVRELRDKLREIGWVKRPMLFPISVYIILAFNADWKAVVNASQGDNSEGIAKAQALLEEVQVAFEQAAAKAAESKAAAEASAAAAAEAAAAADAAREAAEAAAAAAEAARQAEADAFEAERPLKEAEEAVKAAKAEVKSQEDAREAKTKDLTAKSETGGVVSRNKAKQELSMHLAEDPLPLRKAKITLDAADRKAEAARAPFKAAREAAVAAREAADAAAAAAAAAQANAEKTAAAAADRAADAAAAAEAAEAAVAEAEAKVAEAEAFLEEEKNKSGSAQGSIWWLTRELEEKKKYMPSRAR